MRALLMGGQACILYGAAEFSRDIDIVVAIDARNLARLRAALAELRAEPVYFPRLTAAALRRGHGCHFRCWGMSLQGMRLDVMAVLRNTAAFGALWRRRHRVEIEKGLEIDVIGLRDLVDAKKTQRDKDWPMVRRLVETDISRAPAKVPAERVGFWLRECRSAALLCDIARQFPRLAARAGRSREAVRHAMDGRRDDVERALRDEEDRVRAEDRRYWAPLVRELERLRRGRPRDG